MSTILKLGLVLLVVLAVSGPSVAEADLVAYWPMNKGSGNVAYDESDNGVHDNDGSLNSIASWTADRLGSAGSALDFNANSLHMDCGSDSSLNVSSLTLAAWIKPTSGVVNAWDRIIAGNGGWTESYAMVYMKGTYGNRIGVGYGKSDASQTIWKTPANSITEEAWTLVVFTRDSSDNMVVFLNGVSATLESCPANYYIDLNSDRVTVGSKYAGSWSSFKGVLDDAGIWNEALSLGKATALYGLAVESGLYYGLGDAQQLFDVYDGGGASSATIDGLTWVYATGLSTPLGEVSRQGHSCFLALDDSGNGVLGSLIVPEPCSLLLLVLGGFSWLLLFRRTRR